MRLAVLLPLLAGSDVLWMAGGADGCAGLCCRRGETTLVWRKIGVAAGSFISLI